VVDLAYILYFQHDGNKYSYISINKQTDINIVLAFPNIEYFMTIWLIIGCKPTQNVTMNDKTTRRQKRKHKFAKHQKHVKKKNCDIPFVEIG